MHNLIKKIELTLFKIYLANRIQFVRFEGIHSSMKSVKTDVPQGSSLGPILFMILMNDVNNASNKFHVILFMMSLKLLKFTFITGQRGNKQNR